MPIVAIPPRAALFGRARTAAGRAARGAGPPV